ncbi:MULTISPECIES: hypothetical protein [unclassified Rathayibacter]|uniref:hypothetical protein n=1 Tax=unclassified Rathayibacter TaxID=2609250 RepID=UPI0011B04243|nr:MULTISPECIES: hypothetical protein [unclassified Rathayibacter]
MSLRAALAPFFAVSDTGDGALLLRPHAPGGRAMLLVLSGEAEGRLNAKEAPEVVAARIALAIQSARGRERFLIFEGDLLTPSLSSTAVIRDHAPSEASPGDGTWNLYSR